MAFETTICQECPTPIQWPSLRAAYLRCINIALDTRDAMLKDRDARIADLESQLKAMTKDRDAQAEAVAFLGGAVRTTRAHVWTETPGVEVQVFADPDVPHSLRLVVRDVHAKEDLASVRVEAFRLDLLCGPIVRLLLEHRSAMAAAVKGGN